MSSSYDPTLNEKCQICLDPRYQSFLKKLPCNHHFHFHCLHQAWKYSNNPHYSCPACKKLHNKSNVQNQYPMNNMNPIVLYEKILRYNREQCKHRDANDIQCKNCEYPFRGGYCRMHSSSQITKKHEKILMDVMECFIFMKNYHERNNTLKYILIYTIYVHRYMKEMDIFSSYNTLRNDLSELFTNFSSIRQIYDHYELTNFNEYYQKLERMIKK
jgi:hypothetical protein